jgi:hypothetical protein
MGKASPLDAVGYIPLSLIGPQACLQFSSTPATSLRPAAADLAVEVGQMLVYVRVKQQASMTAFATQLSQITEAIAPGGVPAPPPTAPPAPGAAAPKHLPKLQKALKVCDERRCGFVPFAAFMQSHGLSMASGVCLTLSFTYRVEPLSQSDAPIRVCAYHAGHCICGGH